MEPSVTPSLGHLTTPEPLVFAGVRQVVPPHWESGGQVTVEVYGGGQVRRGCGAEPPGQTPESRLLR